MEIPGLSLLRRSAPEVAARLEQLVSRLNSRADAERWAQQQTRALAEAYSRGDVLSVVIEMVERQAGTGEAWAILWRGDPSAEAVSFHGIAGHGDTPPDPEILSRSLLAEVARRAAPIWLDDDLAGLTAIASARSIVASEIRPHGAIPLGERGVVYLAGTDERRIPGGQRARIEAICRLAGGFVDAMPERIDNPPIVPGMVGRSRPMQDLARAVRGFAAVPWPVLVTGETGTGKELVARALHELSPRADKPFVAINCAAIPDELAESVLFGHEKGAFTGADRRKEGLLERTADGTLFLDEVGELSARVQAKLLRVLQEGRYERLGGDRELHFHGRIVAATLRALKTDGSGFREDLYHRLGACVIRVPPLRERREDIRALANHLLARALAEVNGAQVSLSEALLAEIEAMPWPGNVRELDNALKGALARAIARGDRALLPEHIEAPQPDAPRAPPRASEGALCLVSGDTSVPLSGNLSEATEQLQRTLVRSALARAEGNRQAAAQSLGVSRQWLHTLLTRWEKG